MATTDLAFAGTANPSAATSIGRGAPVGTVAHFGQGVNQGLFELCGYLELSRILGWRIIASRYGFLPDVAVRVIGPLLPKLQSSLLVRVFPPEHGFLL